MISSTLHIHADDSIKVSQADLQALLQRVERLEKAQTAVDATTGATLKVGKQHPSLSDSTATTAHRHRLTIGGYGEAVMTRNFYSDHFNRYVDSTSKCKVSENI